MPRKEENVVDKRRGHGVNSWYSNPCMLTEAKYRGMTHAFLEHGLTLRISRDVKAAGTG